MLEKHQLQGMSYTTGTIKEIVKCYNVTIITMFKLLKTLRQ